MNPQDEHLSEIVASVAAELGIVGAQVALLDHGELRQGVTGVTSIETGVPVTCDTLFQIGSTTKVFTAVLVMQLVDEGQIALDVPVVEQLPGLKLSDENALRTLTPRHLMSMSSGIDNGPYTDHGRGDDALTQYVAALTGLPQVFAPGSACGYSNASTNVSGRLIEHVTGQTWEEVLRTRLLEPSGLADSATFAEDIIWRRFAVGHALDESRRPIPLRTWTYSRALGPAGGTLCSTASDLVRLGHLFLHNGKTIDGTQVLAANAVEAMQAREVRVPRTFVAEWWGLGPYGNTWDGVDVMGHSGTNRGGSSFLLWAVGQDVAIATTVNVPEYGYPFARRIAQILFDEALGIHVWQPPEPPDAVEYDAGPLVGEYAGSGFGFSIAVSNGDLTIAGSIRDDALPPSRLIPLTPTTFLPTDPRVDGRRGWALAFIGAEHGPATHLLNGVFNLRRVDDESGARLGR